MKSSRLFKWVTDNWPAKILSVVAAILLFLFYRISTLQERFISIPLRSIMNEQYAPAAPLPPAVRVTIRGKADEIFLIREEDLDSSVDLSGYHSEGIYRVAVSLRKKGTATNADVELKVDPLELTVMMERIVTKTVTVTASTKGFAAKGFELGQSFTVPDHVTIRGPRSRIVPITSISTEDIDLSGKSADFTQRVDLAVNDPTIDVTGVDQVEFHGVMQEIVTVKTLLPIDVVALDLAPDLKLRSDVTTGSTQVQGSQLDIEKIKPGDVTLNVDCSEIRIPGVYTLPIKPSVPAGINVLSYDPERVTLTVTKGGDGQ